MASKLKVDDQVIITTGKDKGRRGTVTKVIVRNKNNSKRKLVYVEGLNMIKKHVRPNPNANQPGGILEQEAPMDISNVAIVNPTTDKADRVGFKTLENGKKVRVFKSNGEQVDA